MKNARLVFMIMSFAFSTAALANAPVNPPNVDCPMKRNEALKQKSELAQQQYVQAMVHGTEKPTEKTVSQPVKTKF